jgi:DNA-binding NarL/FixJ family response regulator
VKFIAIFESNQIYLLGLKVILESNYKLIVLEEISQPFPPVDLLILGFGREHLEKVLRLMNGNEVPRLVFLDEESKPLFGKIFWEIRPASFIHRSSSISSVLEAVNLTLLGGKFIDSKISAWFLDVFEFEANEYSLTKQEINVLELVLKGLSNKEISQKLFISLSTTKFHLKNIYKKTETANRKQLLARFSRFFP